MDRDEIKFRLQQMLHSPDCGICLESTDKILAEFDRLVAELAKADQINGELWEERNQRVRKTTQRVAELQVALDLAVEDVERVLAERDKAKAELEIAGRVTKNWVDQFYRVVGERDEAREEAKDWYDSWFDARGEIEQLHLERDEAREWACRLDAAQQRLGQLLATERERVGELEDENRLLHEHAKLLRERIDELETHLLSATLGLHF